MHTLESDRELKDSTRMSTPTQAKDSTRMSTPTQARPAFGTVLTDQMAIATFREGRWSSHELRPTGSIEIHPAAHVLHYASECFEGFKAYRWADGSIRVFRMDKHIDRMRQSARLLVLPEPDPLQLADMVLTVIDRVRDQVPEPPGALYLRPLLYGTMPNIGAASPSLTHCNISDTSKMRSSTPKPMSRAMVSSESRVTPCRKVESRLRVRMRPSRNSRKFAAPVSCTEPPGQNSTWSTRYLSRAASVGPMAAA